MTDADLDLMLTALTSLTRLVLIGVDLLIERRELRRFVEPNHESTEITYYSHYGHEWQQQKQEVDTALEARREAVRAACGQSAGPCCLKVSGCFLSRGWQGREQCVCVCICVWVCVCVGGGREATRGERGVAHAHLNQARRHCQEQHQRSVLSYAGTAHPRLCAA